MVGSYIQNSQIINESIKTKYIRLGTTSSLEERGKKSFKKVLRFTKLLWRCLSSLITFQPDLVYISLTAKGIGFYKDGFVVLLLKLFKQRFVFHFHNKGISKCHNKKFDNWLYKRVFSGSEVILLSEHLYNDVKKYLPRNRVHICPNGIPDQPLIKNKYEINRSKSTVQILFLSNLIRSKGVYVLLEACSLLKERNLSFNCVLVGGEGDITEKQLINDIDRLLLNEIVSYAGKKYNNEKQIVFEESHIFAFPTFYPNECFPLVLLEAMQAQLPIVTTYEGGIPSIVTDSVNGFLVSNNDPKALADKLEYLINNAEMRVEMGRAGREKYENNFKLSQFEKRMRNILLDVVHKNE